MAFPNAYISTDEPPKKSVTGAALGLGAIVGVGYLGVVILALSLFTNEYSPVTQVASDYGLGTFALEMNFGFFVAGIGVLCLATAVVSSGRRPVERVGGALLFPSGLALTLNAFFQTDLEGAARTLHGTIHGLGGIVFFFTAPLGLLLISYGLGRRRFGATLVAFVAAAVVLALNGAFSMDAAGLSERIVILVIFTSLIATSLTIFRQA